MVVLLFLVALMCLAGGGAALFTGFDILLGDRGLPIIVTGAVLLAAGLVLLGLVMVARAMRRLERVLLDTLGAQAEAAQLAPFPGDRMAIPDHAEPGRLAPSRRDDDVRPAALRMEDTPGLDLPVGPLARGEGLGNDPPNGDVAPLAAMPPIDDMPELPLPAPGADRKEAHETELAASAEQRSEPRDASPAPAPSVVGRYSSAGNNYVMFSDGTIEAETPTGHHRFTSLDELRAFVAAGGEGVPA